MFTLKGAATTRRPGGPIEYDSLRSKGVLDSAASDGIRMTGEEVLIATQHRSRLHTWLTTWSTNCAGDKVGQFSVLTRSATLFTSKMSGAAIFVFGKRP